MVDVVVIPCYTTILVMTVTMMNFYQPTLVGAGSLHLYELWLNCKVEWGSVAGHVIDGKYHGSLRLFFQKPHESWSLVLNG